MHILGLPVESLSSLYKYILILSKIFLSHFKRKTNIQTDKMSNIGRRKCKYFGAASFSCFSVHFFLNNSGTSQFFCSIFLFLVSKRTDAFLLCPLLFSQLLEPSLLTPDDLLGTDRKSEGRWGN